MERKASEFEAVEFSMYSLHFKPKATKISQHFVVNARRDLTLWTSPFFSWVMENRALTVL